MCIYIYVCVEEAGRGEWSVCLCVEGGALHGGPVPYHLNSCPNTKVGWGGGVGKTMDPWFFSKK